MSTKAIVGCEDIWAPDVRAAIASSVPDNMEIVFASTQDRTRWQEMMAACEYVILGPEKVNDAFFAGAPKLKMIHRWGVGTDSIDRESAARARVSVAITAGANANAVAEHTLMLMLSCLRSLTLIDRSMRKEVWMYSEMRSRAFQLRGRRVGLVGFSNIGQMVAELLKAFGASVVYFDPRRASSEVEARTGASFCEFDELLSSCDIVSLHCPGGGQNWHLLNTDTIGKMKKGAILINTARGDLIDENALASALRSGHLTHAGLDVFENEPADLRNPLLHEDNTCLTPHTAGSVFDNVAKVANHIFRNIDAHMRGVPIPPQDLIVDGGRA